jgi:hypothetical protein
MALPLLHSLWFIEHWQRIDWMLRWILLNLNGTAVVAGREREREQGSSTKHARKLEQQVWEKWVGVAFFFAMYPQDYDWVVQAMLDWCFLGNVVAFCVIVTNDRYSWNTYAEPVSKITNTQDRVFIQKKKKKLSCSDIRTLR